MIALFAMTPVLVSCGDDDNSNAKHATAPEIAAVGTYAGTWSRTLDGATEEGQGTITIDANLDGTNIGTVTFTCAGLSLSATSIANFAWANDEVRFYHNAIGSDNKLGVPFTGKINNGVATSDFILNVKVGRKSYDYTYHFEGINQ